MEEGGRAKGGGGVEEGGGRGIEWRNDPVQCGWRLLYFFERYLIKLFKRKMYYQIYWIHEFYHKYFFERTLTLAQGPGGGDESHLSMSAVDTCKIHAFHFYFAP